MTKEERLELLKQIEKDIYVCSLESTFLEDAKSCAIHSVIEELEQEPTTKNDLGIDCINRDSALKALDYDIESFEFKSGVSKYLDDIAKLLNTIDEIQVNNIKALPSVTPQEPQSFKWCRECREYDQEKHCCHRWSKVIRDTVTEIRQELEDIRAEVNKLKRFELRGKVTPLVNADRVLGIIDKHIAESEVEE